jgi:hypothetical protein
VVANERTARAATAMGANGEKRAIKGWHVIDTAQFKVVAGKVAANGTDPKDGHATAIGECDGEIEVTNVPIGSKIGSIIPQIARGAGVDTT